MLLFGLYNLDGRRSLQSKNASTQILQEWVLLNDACVHVIGIEFVDICTFLVYSLVEGMPISHASFCESRDQTDQLWIPSEQFLRVRPSLHISRPPFQAKGDQRAAYIGDTRATGSRYQQIELLCVFQGRALCAWKLRYKKWSGFDHKGYESRMRYQFFNLGVLTNAIFDCNIQTIMVCLPSFVFTPLRVDNTKLFKQGDHSIAESRRDEILYILVATLFLW